MQRLILVNKKWTALSIFCGCCGLTLFIFAFVLPIILMSLIKSLAAEQAVMTKSNYELWVDFQSQQKGQVPGGTKTNLYRDFTFYDFKNPYDVMFRNKTPIFVEKGPYRYQELQDFRDFNFTNDGDVVEYNFDVRTEGQQEGRVSFANFIAFGAWYQMKNTESPSLFLQAFSAFYFEMKKFIYVTMQAQAIRPSILTEKDIPTLLGSLTPQQQKIVWNDQEFGMKNVTSFINWVVAVRDGVHSNSTQFLKEYFVLSYEQISTIIINLEQKYISAAKNILSNLFCDGKQCKDTYLCAKQWATQGITNEPASGSATPSVITGNNTASGYPELSYYYTEYFLKKIDNSKEYQNLKFDIQWAEKVLNHYENYSVEDPKFYTDQHLLLHIGNIKYLYQFGEQYDETKDKTFLEQIKARFLTPSIQHARVLWEYCKYFEKEFVVQSQNNGTVELAALGTVTSQSLYGEMMVLQNNIVNYLLIDLIGLDLPDCHSVISIIGNQTQTEKFCSRKEYEVWDKQSISKLIYLCDYKGGDYWKQILKEVGYKEYQLDQLCDDEEEVFGLLLEKSHQILKQTYDCALSHCTNLELTHKQWAYSEVSLNPPKNIFQPEKTLANIYTPFRAIEYSYFKNKYSDVVSDQQLNQKQLRYLLSFDCLYNGQMIQNAFIYSINDNLKDYKNWFIFDDFTFLHYLRYIMVEIGFDGFADTRTIQEILFGYMPTIVKAIKEMNPAMGGDPSAPLAGLNINPPLQVQSMHTGKKDINIVRQFVKIDGLPYLTVKVPYFDGNQTHTKLVNPWLIEEPCSLGTDALSYAPNQQKGGKVSTVITDLIRGADLLYNSEVDVFGLKAYQYNVDPKFLDMNKSYHNLKFNGLLNFTTAQNAPIFNSGRHFYLGDSEKLQSFIKVYKYDNLTAEQKANKWDNSYVVVEPLSGVVLQATLNLQVNVEYKKDILFPCDNYAFLPILSIHRAGNWSQSSIDEIFGDLKTGLKVKTIIFWLFIFLGPICIILTGLICWFKRKPYTTIQTDLMRSNGLIQSLQNEENLSNLSNQENQNIVQGSDVQN